MAKIKVEVEVSKETYELALGLAQIAKAVKQAAKDGFQLGQDLPPVVATLFGQMVAIEGVDKISSEIAEDPAAFGKAVALGLADVYSAVKGEDAA